MRWLWLLALIVITGCAPSLPTQQLPTGCQGNFSVTQLRSGQWLQGQSTWRLRQGVLLEIGMKKIPLEGFLRLDLKQRSARLVALNEIGLVLFDLLVRDETTQLVRAVPQLQNRAGFADGIALSLRRVFLQPVLSASDAINVAENLQRISVQSGAEQVRFSFDCHGDLRLLFGSSGEQSWRVQYNAYGDHAGMRLPEEIIYYDRSHAVKLTLWLREARQEP